MLFRIVLVFLFVLFNLGIVSGQSSKTKPAPQVAPDNQAIRSSPAYAELLLHKTEIDSTLESLLVDYNEEYPKVKQLRVESNFVNAEIIRLMTVKPADAGKLTLALGRLMLRKVELETELASLRVQYKDDHPDVRKLTRRIEVFEAAIREILG